MIALNHILVATDFSEPSEAALSYGRELATRFNATLHVLHVAQNVYITTFGAENYAAIAPDLQQQIEEDARRRLGELLIDSDKSGPKTIPVVMTASSPAFAIIDYTKDHEIDATGYRADSSTRYTGYCDAIAANSDSGAPTGSGKCFCPLDATRTYSRRIGARSSTPTLARRTRTEPP